MIKLRGNQMDQMNLMKLDLLKLTMNYEASNAKQFKIHQQHYVVHDPLDSKAVATAPLAHENIPSACREK